MRVLYQEYVQAKASAWSATSSHSEAYRLNRVLDLIDGDPLKLLQGLADREYGSYTKQTIWTRVMAFWEWGIANGKLQEPNPYKEYRKKNPRMFRGAYKRKPCKQTFDDIMVKLKTIPDPVMQNTAIVQMTGGLRFCELFTIHDGQVIGKGNKIRKVYLPNPIGPLIDRKQYSAYLRQLKTFGLTTHHLRHARATHFSESGASVFELRKFMGWSDIKVAESYVNARDERIQMLAKIRTETKVLGVMGVLKLLAKTVRETVK